MQQMNKNEILFFKIFRNNIIRRHIFSFKSNIRLLDEKYIKYNEVTNVEKLSRSYKELLKLKVKNGDILDFSTSFTTSKTILYKTFQNDKQDNEFWENLFKNYSSRFIGDKETVEKTVGLSMISDNVIPIRILFESNYYNPKVEEKIKLYKESISMCKLKVAQYLMDNHQLELNQSDKNSLWNTILKKDALSNVDLYKETQIKSIEFLIHKLKLQAPGSSLRQINFNCIIDFLLNQVDLQYILQVCNIISFLKDSLVQFKRPKPISIPLPSFTILSKLELQEIGKLDSSILSKSIHDIDRCYDELLKPLVVMAITYTNSNLLDNVLIYNARYCNDYSIDLNLPKENKKFAAECELSTGEYKYCKLYSSVLYYTRNTEIDLFRYCHEDYEKKKQYMTEYFQDLKENHSTPRNRLSLEYILKYLFKHSDLKLLEFTMDKLKSFKQVHLKNDEINNLFIWIIMNDGNKSFNSENVFNLVYGIEEFKKYFKFKQFMNCESFLNYFKSNYQNDYKQSVGNFKFHPDYLSSDFIFHNENFYDFTDSISKFNFWKKFSFKSVPQDLTLGKFIQILQIIPKFQSYHCCNSFEIYNWVLLNTPLNQRHNVQFNYQIDFTNCLNYQFMYHYYNDDFDLSILELKRVLNNFDGAFITKTEISRILFTELDEEKFIQNLVTLGHSNSLKQLMDFLTNEFQNNDNNIDDGSSIISKCWDIIFESISLTNRFDLIDYFQENYGDSIMFDFYKPNSKSFKMAIDNFNYEIVNKILSKQQ